MIEIIPAVLPKSFDDLKEHLEKIVGVTRAVQVDIVDGHFAHNKTWPYKDGASFKKIVEDQKGLPLWDNFDYEFDLMVQDSTVAKDYVRAGASHVVLHLGSANVIAAFQQLLELREEGGAFSVQVGVALPSTAQPDELEAFESQFDYVQVMGIARVGYQGEPFDEHAVYLVERLRKRYPQLAIQVDGGVTKENVAALAKAGATKLVVGHDIWEADDPVAEFRELTAMVNQNNSG